MNTIEQEIQGFDFDNVGVLEGPRNTEGPITLEEHEALEAQGEVVSVERIQRRERAHFLASRIVARETAQPGDPDYIA